jgi:hypothetical protein
VSAFLPLWHVFSLEITRFLNVIIVGKIFFSLIFFKNKDIKNKKTMYTIRNTLKILNHQYHTQQKNKLKIHIYSIIHTNPLLKKAHQESCNAIVKTCITTTKQDARGI